MKAKGLLFETFALSNSLRLFRRCVYRYFPHAFVASVREVATENGKYLRGCFVQAF